MSNIVQVNQTPSPNNIIWQQVAVKQPEDPDKNNFRIQASVSGIEIVSVTKCEIKNYDSGKTIDLKDELQNGAIEFDFIMRGSGFQQVLNSMLWAKQNDYKKYFRMKFYIVKQLVENIKKYKRPERKDFYFDLIRENIIKFFEILSPTEMVEMLTELEKHGFTRL